MIVHGEHKTRVWASMAVLGHSPFLLERKKVEKNAQKWILGVYIDPVLLHITYMNNGTEPQRKVTTMQIELKTYTFAHNAERGAKRKGYVSYDIRPLTDGTFALKHRANGDGPVNLIWAYCVKHLGGEVGNSRESLIAAAKQVKAELIEQGFKVNTVKTQVSRFCVTRGNKADWLAYEKAHRDGLIREHGMHPVDAKRFEGRKVKHNTSKV